ncbi:MAG TPA: DUF2627 domain-containing protein [Bacilli bacterium]
MKQMAARMIAVLLLVIPGAAATYGFLLMKDAVFAAFGPPRFPFLRFLAGLLLFAGGVAFIAGWVNFRDRKRNYGFKKKRPRF